jgi:hypothetical protein
LRTDVRRAEFTKLTGLTPQFFNSLSRREQLPFLRVPVTGGGWGDYPPAMAFKTMLALALADAGATQYEAGHFLEAEYELLAECGLSPAELIETDIFLGYLRIASSEFDPEIGRYTQLAVRRPVCGAIAHVTSEIIRLQGDPNRGGLHSVVLVNASEHLRMLRDRAVFQHLDASIVDQVFYEPTS